MAHTLQMRLGLAGLGLAGLGGLSACSQPAPGEETATLASCYVTIQKAAIAVQIVRDEMAPADRIEATEALAEATRNVVLVWARREGLELTAEDLKAETPEARAFAEGLHAEAGLQGQALTSEMSEASDAPGQWRAKYDAALDCAGRVAP